MWLMYSSTTMQHNHCGHRVTGCLKQPLVIPSGISLGHQSTQTVVLAKTQYVERDESDLDVSAVNARREQLCLSLGRLPTLKQ